MTPATTIESEVVDVIAIEEAQMVHEPGLTSDVSGAFNESVITRTRA